MSDPFLSEIRLVAFTFAPKGWAFANGQTLPINQNTALFSLVGTTYGGNGTTTFLLPNLQGRVVVHQGTGQQLFLLGQAGGESYHTLTVNEMPTHNHALNTVSFPGNSPQPFGNHLAMGPLSLGFHEQSSAISTLPAGTISNTGGSQPHYNMMPYVVLNYVIAMTGIYPSRS